MLDNYRKFIYNNKSKFDLNYEINIEPLEIKIDLSKSYNYNKNYIEKIFKSKPEYKNRVPGIWIIEDSKENIKKNAEFSVYEVASTCNLLEEMLKDLQFIYLGKRDIRKDIYKRYKKNVYRRYKYQQIYKLIKEKTKRNNNAVIIFKHIIKESNRSNREDLELKIAIDMEAIWWSPNKAQLKYIKNCLKE